MSVLDRFHRFRQSDSWLYAVMMIAAGASLVASFVLSVDAITLAADPHAGLGCNINTVISCGAVGTSWQANLLGFPNAFLGMMTEPVLIAVAIAGFNGVRFTKGFMIGVQGIVLLALGFAYWLFFQSSFVIGALCPWCLAVTFSTTVLFAALTHLNIRDDNLFLPRKLQSGLETWLRLDLDLLVLIAWLAAMVVLVFVKYGSALFG
ncbi:MAG: vitamin K epoxide reductase family protein [Propionibacteriales bacterium]|nr:vitamin K epoxide reductase family protein [Propionibacteriales bacterium]